MDSHQKGLLRIIEILQSHPEGMTIIDIAVAARISRNTAAKRLNVLLAFGQVEMETVGAARLYHLANRVPFSLLLNSTTDGIAVLDSSLRVVQVNDKFLDLFEIGREEVVGRPAEELPLSIFSRIEILTQFKRAAQGKTQSTETRFAIQDRDYYLEMKMIPIAFENGELGVTAIIENVTERKLAEHEIERQHHFMEELREIQERFRVLFEQAPIGAALIDTDGYLVKTNPSFQKNTGYTGDELCKMCFTELIHPDDTSGEWSWFHDLLTGKQEYHPYGETFSSQGWSNNMGRSQHFIGPGL